MEDLVIGIIAILVGGMLTLAGYAALRVVIAIWGALAGFLLGAGAVATLTGDGFLVTVLGWGVGLALAIVFGMIAYLYYAVSVVLAMSVIGFTLGSTLLAALGVTWTWLLVLAGVAGGILLAILAIVGDLPMLLLTVLGALAGASITTTGLLLVFGVLDRTDLAEPETTTSLELSWWWTALYLTLAVLGMAIQLRDQAARSGTLRDSWERTV
ncbi:MAG: DUF4203 domain-containing protein [Nitriliruptoraceae bacterium]